MKVEYIKVLEADGVNIYLDEVGYYLIEQKTAPDGTNYESPIRLGRSAATVRFVLAKLLDWKERYANASPAEAEALIAEIQKVNGLPRVKYPQIKDLK